MTCQIYSLCDIVRRMRPISGVCIAASVVFLLCVAKTSIVVYSCEDLGQPTTVIVAINTLS